MQTYSEYQTDTNKYQNIIEKKCKRSKSNFVRWPYPQQAQQSNLCTFKDDGRHHFVNHQNIKGKTNESILQRICTLQTKLLFFVNFTFYGKWNHCVRKCANISYNLQWLSEIRIAGNNWNFSRLLGVTIIYTKKIQEDIVHSMLSDIVHF